LIQTQSQLQKITEIDLRNKVLAELFWLLESWVVEQKLD
jgi:hypothetical protein